MNLSTYKKSILLTSITSVLFLFLFISLYFYTIQQEKNDYELTKKELQKEIESLLDSSWQHFKNQITDMSFWDEFVKYTTTKSKKWFDFYIATAIDVYALDLVSVYDLKGNLIHAKSNAKLNEDIIPKNLFPVLKQKKYINFFIKDSGVVYNVFASTIHPSNDPEKKTSTAGYFFMALRLDQKYFNKIQEISSANKCEIIFNSLEKNQNEENKNVSIYKELNDYNNQNIGNFYFYKKYSRDFSTSKIVLRIIIAAFIIYFIIALYSSRIWFYKPLTLITNILENSDNDKDIQSLKEIKGEFGHIGDLFEDNNIQKSKLINAKLDAEKSDKLKTIFLANLSHEIRTPINAINGFSELLLNTKTNAEEKREYLTVINQSGKNLVGIIDDLIEMSKIESNLILPNLSHFDLESCIKELYESLKVTVVPNSNLEFKLIPCKNKPEFDIVTDAIKLKQIIINLVNNAIKFTEKGQVTLQYDIDETKNLIHFYITDTGIGITEENLVKIFERFSRVESDLSIKVGGLGLGLSITKAYIELLNGSIDLQSKVGKGSTFHFTIPLQYETTKVKKSKVEKLSFISNEQTKTILIAEDDNINFLLFQKIMQTFNYTIIRATNGQEAVKICTENKNIDLVLMDIKMPIMSGFEAITHIRPLLPNIPIIAQTAYSSDEDKIKIQNSGFTDYISKPLDRNKLNKMIDLYLNTNT